jgi:phage shock protein PspC (stress-responsive transcriptional regulator)
MSNKKLYRSYKNRILGGVAGGLAEYTEADVTLIRLILALIMLSGVGILAYFLAWVIIPIDPNSNSSKDGADEIKASAERFAEEIRRTFNEDRPKRNNYEPVSWFGWFLVVIGVFFLLETLIGFSIWTHFWPIIVILLGVVLLAKGLER